MNYPDPYCSRLYATTVAMVIYLSGMTCAQPDSIQGGGENPVVRMANMVPMTQPTAPPNSQLNIETKPNLERFILPQSQAAPGIIGSLDRDLRWGTTAKTWTAPNFYHRPLYFEQPNLERYGHFHKHWQAASALSAAHFFATVPTIPYQIGKQPSCSRSYVLGYGRPGDCNLRQGLVPDFSVKGGLLEATAITGLVFLIP